MLRNIFFQVNSSISIAIGPVTLSVFYKSGSTELNAGIRVVPHKLLSILSFPTLSWYFVNPFSVVTLSDILSEPLEYRLLFLPEMLKTTMLEANPSSDINQHLT